MILLNFYILYMNKEISRSFFRFMIYLFLNEKLMNEMIVQIILEQSSKTIVDHLKLLDFFMFRRLYS